MKLVFGHDDAVAAWVAKRIPHVDEFRDYTAIGVADGNRPVAGVVFNEYYKNYSTMQLSMAASTPKWAQRGIIRGILSYPFEQQGVNKLWTATPAKNKRAIKFNEGVGFTKEAILSRHFGKDHAVICRMFLKDYTKIYKGKDHGQKFAKRATSA